MNRSLRWISWGAKIGLVALLLHAVAFPDLAQYKGKGIGWRLLFYPICCIVVPVVWAALGRRRAAFRYPHLIDLCVVAPFLLDTAGNTANLYDTVNWWDDLMHFVTWVPWVIGAGLAIRFAGLKRFNTAALTVGFGAVTHVLWEIMEYVAFIRGNPNELTSAYTDTIGDLAFSLTGSFTGATAVGTVLWRLGTAERLHGAGQ